MSFVKGDSNGFASLQTPGLCEINRTKRTSPLSNDYLLKLIKSSLTPVRWYDNYNTYLVPTITTWILYQLSIRWMIPKPLKSCSLPLSTSLLRTGYAQLSSASALSSYYSSMSRTEPWIGSPCQTPSLLLVRWPSRRNRFMRSGFRSITKTTCSTRF